MIKIKNSQITILDESITFSLQQLSQTCNIHAELIIEMVEYGLLEPIGKSPEKWSFPSSDLERSRIALHLQRDLGVNFAGIALALELLEEIKDLRAKLNLLEHHQNFRRES